jgi:hypothetical protein
MMRLQRIAMSATVGAIGVAAATTLGAGTAAAAPSGSSAAETIARLQADGNRVVVNKVGAGSLDQCSITSVSPVTTNPLPSGNPLTGIPNTQSVTIVHVGLKC